MNERTQHELRQRRNVGEELGIKNGVYHGRVKLREDHRFWKLHTPFLMNLGILGEIFGGGFRSEERERKTWIVNRV